MLVGIYGSKELFVKEYSRLLAERLLKTGGAEVSLSRFNISELFQNERNKFGEFSTTKSFILYQRFRKQQLGLNLGFTRAVRKIWNLVALRNRRIV